MTWKVPEGGAWGERVGGRVVPREPVKDEQAVARGVREDIYRVEKQKEEDAAKLKGTQ